MEYYVFCTLHNHYVGGPFPTYESASEFLDDYSNVHPDHHLIIEQQV